MDFTRFINSQDIRAHLKEIGYPFTAPEAAYLVYQSQDATMEERLAAWREIVQTMPDCSMDERLNMKAIDSFHAFLRAYIDLQMEGLDRFQRNAGSIYTYAYYDGENCGVNDDGWSECGEWFSTFNRCLAHFKEEFESNENGITKLCIKKQRLDSPPTNWRYACSMNMNARFEVLSCELSEYTNEEREIDSAFEGMWFSFPTPFHRGDILKCAGYSLTEQPFVLDRLCTWDEKMMIQNGFSPEDRRTKSVDRITGNLRRNGDITDMTALGYGYLQSNGIWCDHMTHSYLNLEYLREPLAREQRVLKPISEFLKGNCDVGLLLKSYGLILLEEKYKGLRYRTGYTEEGLALMGLGHIKERND